MIKFLKVNIFVAHLILTLKTKFIDVLYITLCIIYLFKIKTILIILFMTHATKEQYILESCIQDTLSSRLAFRLSASREQRYLAYNLESRHQFLTDHVSHY